LGLFVLSIHQWYVENKRNKKSNNSFFYQGGMKAVIWTDVLQAVVIFIGLLAAMIQGYKMTLQKNKSKLFVSF
jgi:hypothetical protein